MKKSWAATFVFILALTSAVFSDEPQKSKIEVIGKTHSIAAFQYFGGAGAGVSGLANTYGMSIFQFNLGGKQSAFNGSGITTNSNFPLVDGEALTNNTHLGFTSEFSRNLKGGLLVEFYSLIGDTTIGRVFGEELPWDNFPRTGDQTIRPAHFQADLYNAFLEGSHDDFKFKFVGGNLTPRSLPEFTLKEMNQVKLGSLVYRAPITNASFFEKEDRKIEEGRHPLRGFDFIGDYAYDDKKSVHFETFLGDTKPTPLSDIDRTAYGGRMAADIAEGNAGITYVFNEGFKQNSGIEENQSVWAVDSSYNLTSWLVPYFTFAHTEYERESANESHTGNAYAAGTLIKFPQKQEFKVQYQRLGENYDLMAYHKTEHYPGNSQGVNAQLTIPFNDKLKVKGTIYHLQQIETVTTGDDTIFGDSFFPSVADSEKGTIDVQRVSADWQATKVVSLGGYVEHAKFYKEAPAVPTSIDKDVYNFYAGLGYALGEKLKAEAGFRRFLSLGDWQTMSFESYQDIPEAALTCKINKDSSAHFIYHYYNFEDDNDASRGQNDYYGHQVILEAKINF